MPKKYTKRCPNRYRRYPPKTGKCREKTHKQFIKAHLQKIARLQKSPAYKKRVAAQVAANTDDDDDDELTFYDAVQGSRRPPLH
jgi:hypothetical protein